MEQKSKFNTTKRWLPPRPANTRGRGGRKFGQPAFDRQPRPAFGASLNPYISLRSLNLFGLRTQKSLRYQESVLLTGSTLNLANAYVFSANGLFDPNVTGTGHQPMGFDQMMVAYNHYTVIASRIIVVFTNNTAASARVGVSISGTTTINTNYNNLLENGNIITTAITPLNVYGSSARLEKMHRPGQFQGLDDILDDPDMRGDSASNPTEQSYFHLSIWDPNSASAPQALIDVIIEYDVVFHEPKSFTSS